MTATKVATMGLKGSAHFTLLPRKSPVFLKSGAYVTAINAKYLHNKNPISFSISFSQNGFGVSMNVPLLSDSVAKATNIYYSV